MTSDGLSRLVALLGAPGAGKGTVAARLAADGMAVVSTGSLIRDRIARGGPNGIRLAGFIDAGRLVPDELLMEIVVQPLSELRKSGVAVLDGFPRSLGQAHALDRLAEESGWQVQAAYLDVPVSVARERLADRLLCPGCGRIYHRVLVPPRIPGRCDGCAVVLGVRSDDSARAVRQRIAEFGPAIHRVLEHYRARSALAVIDGVRPPGQVYGHIAACLPTDGPPA